MLRSLLICLYFLLTPLTTATAIADVARPVLYSYWAGWANAPIPDTKFDGLLLAFAAIKSDGAGNFFTDYSGSGNFQLPSSSGPYATWNNWEHKYWTAGARGFLSYGGGTNNEFREMIINADPTQLDKIAGEIKANIKKYFFDGVDLDIEDWWNYSNADNTHFATNLATLIKILRKSMDSDSTTTGKPIMLAVGWNSAGNITGMPDTGNDYAGTMLPFYNDVEAMDAISKINVMAYNTGVANFYSRLDLVNNILNQFALSGVPKQKIVFGIQPCESNNASPTSIAAVSALGQNIKNNNYGGLFLWGIGASGMCGRNPADYIKGMQQGLDNN